MRYSFLEGGEVSAAFGFPLPAKSQTGIAQRWLGEIQDQ